MSAVAACRAWVAEVVVGLGLCPWAARPFADGRVRFVGVPAAALEGVVHAVLDEAQELSRAAPEASTLVVLEGATDLDFAQLLGLIDVCTEVLGTVDLADEIQLVGFHPAFRYDGAAADDAANQTNRSPVPMIHLLQRADLDAVRADGAAVSERNAAVLRARAASGAPG